MTKKNAGYSLVEVLIALAITSVVLLTVVTLFYMGKRNVYSGKQQTYAVSVGTRILEDISQMTATDLQANFGMDDTTTLASNTINSVAYAGSTVLDTNTCTGTPVACTSDTNGYLATWFSLIDPTKLQDARIRMVIVPLSPKDSTKPVTTAQFFKTRVIINWNEAQRKRYAYYDTTLFNRQ